MDQETIARLRPRSVNNESLALFAALKNTLQLNQELQVQLLEAAKVIEHLTSLLESKNGN